MVQEQVNMSNPTTTTTDNEKIAKGKTQIMYFFCSLALNCNLPSQSEVYVIAVTQNERSNTTMPISKTAAIIVFIID